MRNKYILVLFSCPKIGVYQGRETKKKKFCQKTEVYNHLNNDLLHSSCVKDHAVVKHCIYGRSIVLEKIGN